MQAQQEQHSSINIPLLAPDEELMDFYFTDSAGGLPNTSDAIVDLEGAIVVDRLMALSV